MAIDEINEAVDVAASARFVRVAVKPGEVEPNES